MQYNLTERAEEEREKVNRSSVKYRRIQIEGILRDRHKGREELVEIRGIGGQGEKTKKGK